MSQIGQKRALPELCSSRSTIDMSCVTRLAGAKQLD